MLSSQLSSYLLQGMLKLSNSTKKVKNRYGPSKPPSSLPARAAIQAISTSDLSELLGPIDCSYIPVNSLEIIDIPWEFGGGFNGKAGPIGLFVLSVFVAPRAELEAAPGE